MIKQRFCVSILRYANEADRGLMYFTATHLNAQNNKQYVSNTSYIGFAPGGNRDSLSCCTDKYKLHFRIGSQMNHAGLKRVPIVVKGEEDD